MLFLLALAATAPTSVQPVQIVSRFLAKVSAHDDSAAMMLTPDAFVSYDNGEDVRLTAEWLQPVIKMCKVKGSQLSPTLPEWVGPKVNVDTTFTCLVGSKKRELTFTFFVVGSKIAGGVPH